MSRPQRPPCFQCRCRKVRCDRRQYSCGNCERLQFKCSFQDTAETVSCFGARSNDPSRSGDRPDRRRAVQACVECHRQKIRCSGEIPECVNCYRRQRKCFYPAAKQPVSSPPLDHRKDERRGNQVTQGQDVPEQAQLTGLLPTVDQNELLRGLDGFFSHLYPLPPFAFLHEPSIRRQFMSGTLDRCLALTIVAVVNLYLSPSPRSSDEDALWIAAAEMDIWVHIEKPSIFQLQSLLLVIHYRIQTGHFSRAYMLAGLAARAATALRLNYERPELSFVAQETRRRVLWALVSIDGRFSVGLPEYETMPHSIIYQRLPCREETFWEGSTRQLAHQEPSTCADTTRRPSLLAACIQLFKVQRDTMRLTRQLALSEQPLADLRGLVQEIQNDLGRLHADVELSIDFSLSSPTQATSMENSRWFARYLLASVSWHQCHCDLYRLFVPGFPEAAPRVVMDAIEPSFRDQAVQACHHHAQQIHRLLSRVLNLSTSPVLPLYIGICAYHATRLTLFLSSSSNVSVPCDMESALESASTALHVLTRFFSASPCAEKIIADLNRLVQLSGVSRRPIEESEWRRSPSCDQGRHRHSHLAIHSLIRQANFVDTGYDT